MTNRARHRRQALQKSVNASDSEELRVQALQGGSCEVCRAPVHACKGRRRRFCSSHCRLLAWAVDALATALQQGKAEGLRDGIGRLTS